MAIYKIADENEGFERLPETSFADEGIMERDDLQRMLSKQPDVLEEDLFILAEEYSDWEDSRRRIDLLALDSDGRLVVVELKRDDYADTHMELQAVRYAALVANMTLEQAIDAHRTYMTQWNIEGDAEARVSQFLGRLPGDGGDATISSENPRIILVSADFSKEMTTSALWLNQVGLDITCMQLKPHKLGDSVFVESSQIIPLREAEEYTIQQRKRQVEIQEVSGPSAYKGADKFREAIQSASAEGKAMLSKLYTMATELEEENLAELTTTVGVRNTTLALTLPRSGERLVTIVKNGAWCNLTLSESRFDLYAPKAKARLDEEVVKGEWRMASWENIDPFLDILPEAYREADENT